MTTFLAQLREAVELRMGAIQVWDGRGASREAAECCWLLPYSSFLLGEGFLCFLLQQGGENDCPGLTRPRSHMTS